MMNLDLTGHRALVCASSKGIGRACAEELADLGCQVTILARDEALLKEVVSLLPTPQKQKHEYLVLDLSDLSHLEKVIKNHLKNKPIDILVNNAGGPKPGPISEATAEQFEGAFNMHLQVNVLLTRLLLPGMKEKKYGRIINITSTSVKAPIDGLGVSNTIRWAVTAWAKTLSREVAQFGITVNSVLPGYIATDRHHQVVEMKAKKAGITPEEAEERLVAEIPVGFVAKPSVMGQAVAYLASPAASYINGIVLPVDGGRLPTV